MNRGHEDEWRNRNININGGNGDERRNTNTNGGGRGGGGNQDDERRNRNLNINGGTNPMASSFHPTTNQISLQSILPENQDPYFGNPLLSSLYNNRNPDVLLTDDLYPWNNCNSGYSHYRDLDNISNSLSRMQLASEDQQQQQRRTRVQSAAMGLQLNDCLSFSDYVQLGSYGQPNYSSLEDLTGCLTVVAKDLQGSTFLLRKLSTGNPQEIQMIFSELKEDIFVLMDHASAHFVIQKLLEVGSERQVTELVHTVTSYPQKFVKVCHNYHGTRVGQKMVECIKTQSQRSMLMQVLNQTHYALALIKSEEGNHIIQQCLRQFPFLDTQNIMMVIAENCLDIATNKSGCCVLQKCLSSAVLQKCLFSSGLHIFELIVSQITSNAFALSSHPYGNYVVQYLVSMKTPWLTQNVLNCLQGKFIQVSLNKFGSHVMEELFKECDDEQIYMMVYEISGSQDFLKFLQDPYGNYVAQSAIIRSKGELHDALVRCIMKNSVFLQSHPHGKKVLDRAMGK